jgi:hypothetical protein
MENTDVDQPAEVDPAAEPNSSTTPSRRWHLPLAIVVVIAALTTGALVARAWTNREPDPVRTAQANCEQWAGSMPAMQRPDQDWCRQAASWMAEPMGGSGAMMGDNATDIEAVCRARMASFSTDAATLCADMARWMSDGHAGPMMGGGAR